MNKKFFVLGACALSLMFSACSDEMDPNDPASVRKYLTKQSIPFTPNKFISYIGQNDTAKMTLFLQAAYDINSTDDNGNSAVAIADRVGHESINITYNYAHLFPSTQNDMADRLNQFRKDGV